MTTIPNFILPSDNIITNPSGAIDQEGNSPNVGSNGWVGPDRWKGFGSGAGAWVIEQTSIAQGTLPNAPTVSTAVRCRVTTQDATKDAGDYYFLAQIIQGYRVKDLLSGTAAAKTVTMSFYAKSSVAGEYTANLKNDAEDRFYNHTFTLAADTWTYIEFNVTMDTTGTWEIGKGRGLLFRIDLGSGSTYQNASSGAWGSGNILAATGQASLLAGPVGSTFDLTAVQMREGGVNTPHVEPDFHDELRECKRFLQSSCEYGTTFGTDTRKSNFSLFTVTLANGYMWGTIPFEVSMADIPSVEIRNAQGNTSRMLSDGTLGNLPADSGVPNTDWTNTKQFSIQNASGSAISPAGQMVVGQWQARAANF